MAKYNRVLKLTSIELTVTPNNKTEYPKAYILARYKMKMPFSIKFLMEQKGQFSGRRKWILVGWKGMEMRNLVLHGHNILSIEVKIDEKEYIFGVQWKAPEKPYDDTWVLKSYANKLNGAKDLSEERIQEFLDTINAKWNWNVDDFKN